MSKDLSPLLIAKISQSPGQFEDIFTRIQKKLELFNEDDEENTEEYQIQFKERFNGSKAQIYRAIDTSEQLSLDSRQRFETISHWVAILRNQNEMFIKRNEGEEEEETDHKGNMAYAFQENAMELKALENSLITQLREIVTNKETPSSIRLNKIFEQASNELGSRQSVHYQLCANIDEANKKFNAVTKENLNLKVELDHLKEELETFQAKDSYTIVQKSKKLAVAEREWYTRRRQLLNQIDDIYNELRIYEHPDKSFQMLINRSKNNDDELAKFEKSLEDRQRDVAQESRISESTASSVLDQLEKELKNARNSQLSSEKRQTKLQLKKLSIIQERLIKKIQKENTANKKELEKKLKKAGSEEEAVEIIEQEHNVDVHLMQARFDKEQAELEEINMRHLEAMSVAFEHQMREIRIAKETINNILSTSLQRMTQQIDNRNIELSAMQAELTSLDGIVIDVTEEFEQAQLLHQQNQDKLDIKNGKINSKRQEVKDYIDSADQFIVKGNKIIRELEKQLIIKTNHSKKYQGDVLYHLKVKKRSPSAPARYNKFEPRWVEEIPQEEEDDMEIIEEIGPDGKIIRRKVKKGKKGTDSSKKSSKTKSIKPPTKTKNSSMNKKSNPRKTGSTNHKSGGRKKGKKKNGTGDDDDDSEYYSDEYSDYSDEYDDEYGDGKRIPKEELFKFRSKEDYVDEEGITRHVYRNKATKNRATDDILCESFISNHGTKRKRYRKIPKDMNEIKFDPKDDFLDDDGNIFHLYKRIVQKFYYDPDEDIIDSEGNVRHVFRDAKTHKIASNHLLLIEYTNKDGELKRKYVLFDPNMKNVYFDPKDDYMDEDGNVYHVYRQCQKPKHSSKTKDKFGNPKKSANSGKGNNSRRGNNKNNSNNNKTGGNRRHGNTAGGGTRRRRVLMNADGTLVRRRRTNLGPNGEVEYYSDEYEYEEDDSEFEYDSNEDTVDERGIVRHKYRKVKTRERANSDLKTKEYIDEDGEKHIVFVKAPEKLEVFNSKYDFFGQDGGKHHVDKADEFYFNPDEDYIDENGTLRHVFRFKTTGEKVSFDIVCEEFLDAKGRKRMRYKRFDPTMEGLISDPNDSFFDDKGNKHNVYRREKNEYFYDPTSDEVEEDGKVEHVYRHVQSKEPAKNDLLLEEIIDPIGQKKIKLVKIEKKPEANVIMDTFKRDGQQYHVYRKADDEYVYQESEDYVDDNGLRHHVFRHITSRQRAAGDLIKEEAIDMFGQKYFRFKQLNMLPPLLEYDPNDDFYDEKGNLHHVYQKKSQEYTFDPKEDYEMNGVISHVYRKKSTGETARCDLFFDGKSYTRWNPRNRHGYYDPVNDFVDDQGHVHHIYMISPAIKCIKFKDRDGSLKKTFKDSKNKTVERDLYFDENDDYIDENGIRHHRYKLWTGQFRQVDAIDYFYDDNGILHHIYRIERPEKKRSNSTNSIVNIDPSVIAKQVSTSALETTKEKKGYLPYLIKMNSWQQKHPITARSSVPRRKKDSQGFILELQPPEPLLTAFPSPRRGKTRRYSNPKRFSLNYSYNDQDETEPLTGIFAPGRPQRANFVSATRAADDWTLMNVYRGKVTLKERRKGRVLLVKPVISRYRRLSDSKHNYTKGFT